MIKLEKLNMEKILGSSINNLTSSRAEDTISIKKNAADKYVEKLQN